jgi:hypothetical protein
MAVFWIIYIAVIVFAIVCMWTVFGKAGKPGWGCIVPIYNIILLCDIAGKSRWWTLLCFIPLVNIVAVIILSLGVAKNFGRSDGFGVGLFFLAPIFYGILAFGSSKYSQLPAKQV